MTSLKTDHISLLAHKRILLGVTGSIAAYKSAELTRRLRENFATVRVVMTENAKRFITPLTMQAVSGYPIHEELFDVEAEAAMGHIELARWADLILIAPASADFMARLAGGFANDLLTTLCLAAKAPIVIAPAMNQGMWQHVLTQENRERLVKKNVQFLGPTEGSQACGDLGPGRMMEPIDIVKKVAAGFANTKLAGKRVVITAGPTHEAIDPVRFISNGSSGKMGYALAEAALAAGAAVTLISGPVPQSKPKGIHVVDVVSAQEMFAAVMEKMADCDIFFSVAAVSDYRPEMVSEQKIHKTKEKMALTLTRNPDIVAAVSQLKKRPFIVGFAAETEDVKENAQIKLAKKNLDLIIANQVSVGMGTDENAVTILTANESISLPLTAKSQLARHIIDYVISAFRKKIHE